MFAIAGPAMVANLTTPLIGIVSTTAIGRLGDATLLGGVAMRFPRISRLRWDKPPREADRLETLEQMLGSVTVS